ncbi:Tfp pilus assembly protein PilF [Thiogranum longum]|uniref:Tfp pilus assembly protein PilF n=1 Tax=Thiogranum longum TaxID=1537524 RepID=A0A4R1HBN4_9GAMM|nr:tetratricopeptide repeat-containing sulfotransferase family protein [Thiogranum longum]TCK19387.1 Tfp pilus assembly protein PilF [Thiogranum longum]
MQKNSSLQQIKQSIKDCIHRKELGKARQLLEQACKSDTRDIELWVLAANVHTALRDFDAAIVDYNQALEIGVLNADSCNNLGYLLQARGRYPEAIIALNKALDREKNHLGALYNLALAYATVGDFSNAEHYYKAALKQRPDLTEAHINLGNALRKLKRPEEAMSSYQAAIASDPKSFLANLNLASLLEKMHDLDQAATHAELSLSLHPESYAATLLLSRINRRVGKLHEARALATRSIELAARPVDKAQAYNELGRVLEGLEIYSDAFDAFSRANQVWTDVISSTQLSADAFKDRVSSYSGLLTHIGEQERSQPQLEACDRAPVFLVGFPRSGTTLTEQILAAHPNVISSDEAPFLQQLIDKIPEIMQSDTSYPESVPGLTPENIEVLVEEYWQLVESHVGAKIGDRCFVDKLPLNIVDLGLIYRLFPTASIVVLIRDPRDVCLSCFTQSFVPNQAMAHFLDIKNTALLYADVMSLWMKYRETLPVKWMELRYEDLVAEMPAVVSRVLDFLGEEWDESVLDYFQNSGQRYISTPSYEGVAEPVYTHAIGKYRNYSDEIQAVLPILDPFIKQFGYA